MQSALWALFNVSADQHVLRCLRVTDAADTIVEICVVTRVGARDLIHLFIVRNRKDRNARASRLHSTSTTHNHETVERVRTGEGDAV